VLNQIWSGPRGAGPPGRCHLDGGLAAPCNTHAVRCRCSQSVREVSQPRHAAVQTSPSAATVNPHSTMQGWPDGGAGEARVNNEQQLVGPT